MRQRVLWSTLVLALMLSASGFVLLAGRGGGDGLPGLPTSTTTWSPPPCGTPGAAACPPAPRTSQHEVFGDPATSGQPGWAKQFDVAPTAFDLDGDGADEVIVHSHDTNVYVFDAEGRIVATLPTTYPTGWYIERVLNRVSAAILAPGEAPSLVVTNHAAYVAVWRVDLGRTTHQRIAFDLVWERRMADCHASPGMDAPATLADTDGDGALDILVQTEEVGFYALRALDGSNLWHHCWAGGNAAPVAGDLDGDGRLEVVVASDDGLLAVFDGAGGQPLWTFNAALHVRPAAIPVEPTIADLDGEGEKEVLFIARAVTGPEPEDWAESHMAIFAVHRNPATWQAELVWMRQPEWAHPLSYTHLVVEDVDRDGAADIFGMDWNTVGHSPGSWERLGPAHAFRLDARGEDVWVQTLDTWWSNKDIVLVDMDGDGDAEVLVNAPDPAGFDSLVSLDAATGAPERYLSVPGWQIMRGPVLADLRHDGGLHVIVPASPAVGHARGVLLLFELDVPNATPWRGSP